MKVQNIFRFLNLAVALFWGTLAFSQNKTYYVSPTGTGDGSSWSSTMALKDALKQAVAGDQIWAMGYETISSPDQIYITPDQNGFVLKSGVQLYGGFKGTEKNANDRETLGKPYQLRYRSVLSGDISRNDKLDTDYLIFPTNTTRQDNAKHVLQMNLDPSSGANNNASATVVNGLTIANGQASGSDDDVVGGGIYIYGDNSNGGVFRVERCFLLNNYATRGGGVYVDAAVKNVGTSVSLINQSVIYNNVASMRADNENAGGGVWLEGQATVVNSSIFNNENGGLRLSAGSKSINSTVARNSAGGIDMTQAHQGNEYDVYNSIIWGNTTLSAEFQPKFKNSAFHEVPEGDTDGNVYVTKENRGSSDAPMFDAPSLKTSFDRDFDWHQTAYPLWSWNVLEGSVMHNKGDMNAYQTTVYGNSDMAGNPRVSETIDIGAYEFQHLPQSRIRYVKEGGTGDGTSWENASGDLQKMIDDLADHNTQNMTGEVWVAAGTYAPIGWLDPSKSYTAAFRMRDGINVYGGFAGDETDKKQRAKAGVLPWQYQNVTILKGASYSEDIEWNSVDNEWTVNSSASRHVVWFAPFPYTEGTYFTQTTVLDGVTIMGGNAQGDTGISDFMTDCGGGVFVGRNCQVNNCVIKECSAVSKGGGVYMLGGRLVGSLIYNSSAGSDGGGVFVDNAGMVLQCMITNCSATNGGGVYLDRNALWDGLEHPEYLILSTSIITNNTNKANGAVYCDEGGVVMQSIIAKNKTVRSTDLTDNSASQTGGLYLNEYGLIINSVLWNNELNGSITAQAYAKNPTQDKVRFYNVGISNFNSMVWNNILQVDVLALSDHNETVGTDGEGHISPNFDLTGMPTLYGVDGNMREPAYYWKPITGSNLRAKGLMLGAFPNEVIVSPELDIDGLLFQQTPSLGAYRINATEIVPEVADNGATLRIYIDADCTNPEHNGTSWTTAYRSLNEAVSYFSNLPQGELLINGQTVQVTENTRLELYVLEGNLWPRYAFVNLDPKSATIEIPASLSGAKYYIYGGYRRVAKESGVVERDPFSYRSIINGNHLGKNIENGVYHCITIYENAKVLLDGFHVINGHAAGEATLQYGGGLVIRDNADVTVEKCIFENNTAQEGAAIDARNAALTMVNCVVNNNTNLLETSPVVNARTLSMTHVTFANNQGAVPAGIAENGTSFAVGNSSGDTHNIASVGEEGAKNFANPTNYKGATLGFNTYYGGYSEFRPLTSSVEAGAIINKAQVGPNEPSTDIVGRSRDLGGAADKGAYEAVLPESGRVYYVRTDGDDSHDGLSWDNALATVTAALEKASGYPTASNRPEIWVAEGTYTHKSTDKIHDQYYGYKMVEGVNVYGGFPATGVPGEDDRDPNKYQTVLQAAQQEGPSKPGDNVESVGRVLVQPDHFSVETTWDGFVIQNGFLYSSARLSITGNIMHVDVVELGAASGAGVFLMGNGVLENCIVRKNKIIGYNKNIISDSGGQHGAGGGVYCHGGVIKNCRIIENSVSVYTVHENTTNQAAFTYGGGLYMLNHVQKRVYNEDYGYIVETGILHKAAVYNSIIADNTLYAGRLDPTQQVNFHTMAVGAGACQVSGDFYNNTIVNNKANTGWARCANIICGGMYVYSTAKIYNSIIMNNKGYYDLEGGHAPKGIAKNYMNEQIISFYMSGENGDSENNDSYTVRPENIDVHYSAVGRKVDNNGTVSYIKDKLLEYDDVTYESRNNIFADPLFADEENADYHLLSGSPAINTGTEDITGVTIPDYDAEYTDRIKDCAIDMGAYESSNEGNISCETVEENGAKKYVYYVTQSGAGLRSGASVENAACAMKLQQILTAAGDSALQHTDGQVYVRVAGYNPGTNPFVYHANTLSDAKDPQSYTFVVPEGIIFEGGYSEDFSTRTPLTLRTRLSAIKEATQSMQAVNGYHAVTFKDRNGNMSLDINELTAATIIDGLWLEDGLATSMVGEENPKTMGGGAIVPKGAHVRNCVITNCEAVQGGALYLMPGALVSGCLLQNNTAEDGAGIYADNTGVDADKRSYVISCTITDNTASDMGGGIYQEEGALMALNTVVWGNSASSDRNVSGSVYKKYADNALLKMAQAVDADQTDNNFYPYNYCFVESFEMPASFENTSMTSEEDIYFEDENRFLKVYSPLIKRGLLKGYLEYWQNARQVAERDMNNVLRLQTDYTRADAGAYAYEGGPLEIEELITRIFVSKGSNVQLADGENMETYLGRSFYTSLSHLDDALEYIKRVRQNGTGGANENTVFEIFLGPGIYKPSMRRMDAATTILDQRLNSFDVPVNVKIYGGFSGEELYSYGIDYVPAQSGNITLVKNGDIKDILTKRTFSDLNGNGILEPWELSNQAILSGELDVSLTAKNVYHVVYSSADEGSVTLDGLTVMKGETTNSISSSTSANEIGRGGAIYSNGVDYLLHRCRLMENKAVRGGAMCVRNANATLVGCIVSGNGPSDDSSEGVNMRGGGVYVSGNIGTNGRVASLRAVNTLFVNNETEGSGGAIALNEHATLDLVNCNIVSNKAAEYGAVYVGSTSGNKITNSVVWGNEDQGSQAVINDPNAALTYSASEWLTTEENVHNIHLSTENMAIDGPRFKKPSTVAGVSGNQSTSMWNLASVSVLADVGNGSKENGTEQGEYADWFRNYAPDLQDEYMSQQERYIAPLDENGHTQERKVIDIGVYEYPHPVDLSKLDAVYVATQDAGLANGTSWANAISDLKQAIIAMSNPTGFEQVKKKKIYVRDGEYSSAGLSQNNVAFPLYMSQNSDFGTALEIVGSCTGVGHEQNFANPTIVTVNPVQENKTNILLDINDVSAKPVTISGFTFANTSQGDETSVMKPGCGVNIMNIGVGGQVTLKNLAFRNNYGYGISMIANEGNLLLANVLFADGAYADNSVGVGLQAVGNTTVVNATFAQNRMDIEKENGASLSVYNSVSWNNMVQNMPQQGTNVAFDPGIENGDIQNGPNFVNPKAEDVMARDYGIRPSMKLLNKGDNASYNEQVLKQSDLADIPATEKDLANNARQTGKNVDVGAYEYSADLQQVIYVKPVVGGSGSGESWTNATNDLQGAVDLVAVYAANNPGSKGYVFVHNTQPIQDKLRVSMPETMVYGGMSDETSSETEVTALVKDLLGKRQGILENSQRTQMSAGLTLSANSVVDGFEIAGDATIGNEGCLSTSIVKGSVLGQGEKTGLLYNSLVVGNAGNNGNVKGVQAVNVTATGNIADEDNLGNNRSSSVTSTNTYVTDTYWNYQLMETSTDIDKGTLDVTTYMNKVGHRDDLIGNKRVRNVVDNGCFETWYISEGLAEEDRMITATDYPVKKSVVYVCKDQELKIEDASDGTLVYPAGSVFTPGFLLLQHKASLRGNRNHISLTNFAVEREIPNGKSDLIVMPFDVNTATSYWAGITPKRYNGSKRAAYDYKFDKENSEAWTDEDIDQAEMYEGLLFENTTGKDQTLRFYGKSSEPYVEDGTDKTITLKKYNYNEQWTTDADGNVQPSTSNRITYKENMSWNLIGSPYLCDMNYEDLQYGRVIYGYEDGYRTAITYDSDGNSVSGYVPVGSAVFTQTATLKDAEVFSVAQPEGERTGTAFGSAANLQISLSPEQGTRSVREASHADVLQLNAVSPEMARSDFDLSSDGVKWLSDSLSQIYAERSGGRYALLSAVNIEGKVAASVNLPQTGSYVVSIPEDCDASDYDYVRLKDMHTGREVNLLDESYHFTSAEAGEQRDRFMISFGISEQMADGFKITVQDKGNGTVLLSGLQQDDMIRVYDASGILVATEIAEGSEQYLRLKSGVYLFAVHRGSEKTIVKHILR